jgi:hypothetical protein
VGLGFATEETPPRGSEEGAESRRGIGAEERPSDEPREEHAEFPPAELGERFEHEHDTGIAPSEPGTAHGEAPAEAADGSADVAAEDVGTSGAKVTLAEVAATRVQIEGADDAGVAGDARLTARALKMRDFLASQAGEDGSISFSDSLAAEPQVTRRTAARCFYELLNLCSRRVVTLEQKEAYGAIVVTPVQPQFGAVQRP